MAERRPLRASSSRLPRQGYLSALAAQILGPHSCHHAVELRLPLATHSRAKLASLGLHNIKVHHASVHDIDFEQSMRFDRIWVGAGATQDDRAIVATMLKEGGIAVGPFANDQGEQSLDKITRMGRLRSHPGKTGG